MLQAQGLSALGQQMFDAFVQRHSGDLGNVSGLLSYSLSSEMTRETFSITAQRNGDTIQANVAVTDDAAVRWSLNRIRTWLNSGEVSLQTTDRPDFRWRGVIEGFYGTPWTAEQRLRGVEHFGDFGMNMFLVAPKDAKWQRFHWREPLSVDFMTGLTALIDRGAVNGVSVSACVSPGLSVTYSSDDDVRAVVNKFLQMAAVGARHFGLLLDDIPDTLTDDNDIARYGNIASAHADFANRVRLDLMANLSDAHLILCPMHYCGRGDEPYSQVMGDRLHPQIDLMWTGRDICSTYIDIYDAVVFDRTARRPPFYWDNFPVNDGSMFNRLHVGAFEGREAGLHQYSAGLLANPMELFEASMLPLSTVGDYLWNTSTYKPYESWEQNFNDLVRDESDRAALLNFFRMAQGLHGMWAPGFLELMQVAENSWRAGDLATTAQACRQFGNMFIDNYRHIWRDDFSLPLLRAEVSDWLDKYRLGGELLLEFADVVDRVSPRSSGGLEAPAEVKQQLRELRDRYGAHTKRLFGDGYEGMLAGFAAEITYV